MDPNKKSSTYEHHHQKKPSSSELLSSAKLVADAAKASLRHDSANVDKAKVAGAAEDLLSAASSYGKLEEKSYGKYVNKAEDYLHKYHSSHAATTTTTTSTTTATHHNSSSSHSNTQSGSSGSGGYGDYLKMAQGFLKK